MQNNKKQKLSFILLLVVFIVPVILAKFALEYDWFNKGATNRGTLLEPTLDGTALLEETEPHWHFVYVLPETCDQACLNSIYVISQVKTAIGRESDRVSVAFIETENSDVVGVNSVKENAANQLLQKDLEIVNKVFNQVATNGIFISDTLNNIVLSYPTNEDKEKAIMHSRDMLADMKKLLKLSRIG